MPVDLTSSHLQRSLLRLPEAPLLDAAVRVFFPVANNTAVAPSVVLRNKTVETCLSGREKWFMIRESLAKKKPWSRRRGLAAVELGILAPFLAFLFVIALDFARVFYYTMIVTNCARNGAYYGCNDTSTALNNDAIKAAAKKDAANLDLTNLNVTPTPNSSTSPTSLDVNVTYTFTTITRYPGVPSSLTISRTVRMKVSPKVPT
jgi:Flp pilus assembly protein TadG